MKSVYVVYTETKYEGYNTPCGVYSSLENAKKAVLELAAACYADYIYMIPMRLNQYECLIGMPYITLNRTTHNWEYYATGEIAVLKQDTMRGEPNGQA